MYRSFLVLAAAALLAGVAPAAITFTYTSSSIDPLASFSFTLPDTFTPATSNAASFTTGTVTASGNTTFGPITYDDNFRFYTAAAGGGFDSNFDIYTGPLGPDGFEPAASVFTGPTSAPVFLNGSYTFYDADNDEGTLVISGAPTAAPEPAAWAMLIAGFGMIGATLRHRRATVVFA